MRNKIKFWKISTSLFVLGVISLSIIFHFNPADFDPLFLFGEEIETDVQLLIIISPQYAGDAEIKQAITDYVSAVEDKLSWKGKVIGLSKLKNQIRFIDSLIERYNKNNSLVAVELVGEDIMVPLNIEHRDREVPQTDSWADTDGELNPNGSPQIAKPYFTPEVAISLIFPTANLDHQTKKEQLIKTFNKFVKQETEYGNNIKVLGQGGFLKTKWDLDLGAELSQFSQIGSLSIQESPLQQDKTASLDKEWKVYAIWGESMPGFTVLNFDDFTLLGEDKIMKFNVNDLSSLKAPLFLAGASWAGGWHTGNIEKSENMRLDPPVESGSWYGEEVLLNPYLRTAFLGFIKPLPFSRQGIKKLGEGLTIAEAYIGGPVFLNHGVFYGDLTLHFTPYQAKAQPNLTLYDQNFWSTTESILSLSPRSSQNKKTELKAVIRNVGDQTIRDFTVSFFDGNPISYEPSKYKEGVLIGKKNIGELSPNKEIEISQEWIPSSEGYHEIWVIIGDAKLTDGDRWVFSYDGIPNESNIFDNIGWRGIEVQTGKD